MRTYEVHPAGLTDIGHVRATNEDHLLAEGDLFVVADGMGGHGGGEIASRVAIETMREVFATDPSAEGLVRAVTEANRAVLARAAEESGNNRMGTTIAAVALVPVDGEQRLAVVNVGDSRVYLLRQGTMARLTSDHSLVADLVRAGTLTEDEAVSHPERHVLTQAVGVDPEIEPFATEATPESGDRVLLCSDGLFNELRQDEITEVLLTVADTDQAVGTLVAMAKERGGNDNITAVVVDIS